MTRGESGGEVRPRRDLSAGRQRWEEIGDGAAGGAIRPRRVIRAPRRPLPRLDHGL